LDGKLYEVDITKSLGDLTGTESIAVEEYLGGWDKFRAAGTTTRSLIVMVWLARRQAGEATTLEEIADSTRGLVFGKVIDNFDAEDDVGPPDHSPPAPSATPGGSDGSDDRSKHDGSAASAETSEAIGTQV
jgi:hypothetical protein